MSRRVETLQRPVNAQMKIRLAVISSLLALWTTYVVYYTYSAGRWIQETGMPVGIIVNDSIQNLSLIIIPFLATVATVERYRHFNLHLGSKLRRFFWHLIGFTLFVQAVFIPVVGACNVLFNTSFIPLYSDLYFSVEGGSALISAAIEISLNADMMRHVFKNKQELHLHLNNGQAGKSRDQMMDRTSLFQKRLIKYYACLVTADIIAVSIYVLFELIYPVQGSLFGLVDTVVGPLYMPVHILLLTQLLDSFKQEALRKIPKTVTSPTSSNDSCSSHNNCPDTHDSLFQVPTVRTDGYIVDTVLQV